MRALVVGAGVFGVSAARTLRARGHEVTLADPGPVPHPLAESTDISKVVRIDYGADEEYAALAERALAGWRRSPFFHETGVAFLTRRAMAPGGFEHDSYVTLTRRGHRLERLDDAAITRRFPAYRPGVFIDGYFNPQGGWVEASAFIARLLEEALADGVTLRRERVDCIDAGADVTVVCAGAWAARFVPALAGTTLRAVGQPVFHLQPADPAPFQVDRFPVFTADIARTGWYGFPVNADGVVKLGNHGVGVTVDPDAPREVRPEQEAALRKFLAESIPALADASIVHRRLCVYSDTPDEHFFIAAHPTQPGLVVATGGSGHAFKFAPVLGDLIADVAEGRPPPPRFAWREPPPGARGEEAARHKGDP